MTALYHLDTHGTYDACEKKKQTKLLPWINTEAFG